jgi:hypothetical protein
MAAPEATDETGRMGTDAPRASESAMENTQKLCYIRRNSLLPVRVLVKSRVLHVEPRPTGASFAHFSSNSPPATW